MSALIKLAETRGATLVEMMFYRQLWAVPVVTAWIVMGPGLGSIRTQRFGAHVTRTAIGLTGMVFNFGAVLLLPLAEATTLQFTVPIFATILGALVLHETTGWHRWGAVVVGFAGVLIVAQPGSGEFPLFGAFVGLMAALFVAIVAIPLRQIGKTESAGTTVFWFSVLSLPPLGLAYIFQLQSHDWLTWANLIGDRPGRRRRPARAHRLAPIRAGLGRHADGLFEPDLGDLLRLADLRRLPTPWTWLGAPIIIASGLYIVWRERVLHLRNTEGASDAAAS